MLNYEGREGVDPGTEGNTKDRAAKFKHEFKSSAPAAATAAAALPTVEEGNVGELGDREFLFGFIKNIMKECRRRLRVSE